MSDSSLGCWGELAFLTNQLPGVTVSPGSTAFRQGMGAGAGTQDDRLQRDQGREMVAGVMVRGEGRLVT